MKIVYAGSTPPDVLTKSIFLAGPTPRKKEVPSWRPKALKILGKLGFDGVIFVPEDENGGFSRPYQEQVDWEDTCLRLADCIVFWVPRELRTMPAFTTNIEWGVWHNSRKVVLGTPPKTPKMRYLQYYASKLDVPQAKTLEKTLENAIALIGEGVLRQGGEREVPIHIWKQPTFQTWYQSLGTNRRLDGAQLQWQYFTGPDKKFLFAWVLKVNVYHLHEKRSKRSEVLISRSDIAAVLVYYRKSPIGNSKIVLVKEFRPTAMSQDGMVHELPSGSSFNCVDMKQVAESELQEETGVSIDASRFQVHPVRQCHSTLGPHCAHLFSVSLDAEEFSVFEKENGKIHGENEAERTFLEIRTLDQILASSDIDWLHIGMILSVFFAS